VVIFSDFIWHQEQCAFDRLNAIFIFNHNSSKLLDIHVLHIGQTNTINLMWKDKDNTRISVQIDKEDATKNSMNLEIRAQIFN
jgi:hypothetical protein